MKILELIRLESWLGGTVGVLKIDKEVFCFTLEPKDLLNAINESCIPTGQYVCKRVNSPKFGNTFEVSNVPNRGNILFHAGNVAGDTLGCILEGSEVGKLKGERAVLNSGKTFKAFLDAMQGENEAILSVSEVF
jgi:hypothetical protein